MALIQGRITLLPILPILLFYLPFAHSHTHTVRHFTHSLPSSQSQSVLLI